jgi:glycosyltransferase involved in cell wall biosynthesis
MAARLILALRDLQLRSKNLLLIPTHNHPTTIPFAVASAQNQSVEDIDIVVIGDGVDEATRYTLLQLEKQDSRLRFLDLPKGQRHGESYRDWVIRESAADYITYLGDDDLLLKGHMEQMTKVIDGVDFANPLPIFIEPDGTLSHIAGNLDDPLSVIWHLEDSRIQNSISLTGAIHTKDAYLRLATGWEPAPLGVPTDLYMWRKFFRLTDFMGRTSVTATTAKFSSQSRLGISPIDRQKEVQRFWEKTHEPEFESHWNQEVIRAVQLEATRLSIELSKHHNYSMNSRLTAQAISVISRILKALRTIFTRDGGLR